MGGLCTLQAARLPYQSGLMSKGDVMTDFGAAIKAIAAGRRATATLHKAIYDIPIDLPENVVAPDTPIQNVDRVFHVPGIRRQVMPLADSHQLTRGSESEKGYSKQTAQAEADRCLQCGLICYLQDSDSEQDLPAASNA